MGDDPLYLFKRMLQVGTLRHVYEPGDRTPYPIIIERPQLRDVLENMRLPEYMPLFVSIPAGYALSYLMTYSLYRFPIARRQAFGLVYATVLAAGAWIGVKGSYYKLVGFENNGLKWKFDDTRLKKYRFVSDLEGDAYAMLLKRKDLDSAKQY